MQVLFGYNLFKGPLGQMLKPARINAQQDPGTAVLRQRSTRLSNDSAATPAVVVPTAGDGPAGVGRPHLQASRDRQGPCNRQALDSEQAAVGIASDGKVWHQRLCKLPAPASSIGAYAAAGILAASRHCLSCAEADA